VATKTISRCLSLEISKCLDGSGAPPKPVRVYHDSLDRKELKEKRREKDDFNRYKFPHLFLSISNIFSF
jgi:hypothetical protein